MLVTYEWLREGGTKSCEGKQEPKRGNQELHAPSRKNGEKLKAVNCFIEIS